MAATLTLAEINGFDRDTFIAQLRGLFEGAAEWIPEAAWEVRPFATMEDLDLAFATAIGHASREQQTALIQAHPDLVGQAALNGTLSRASTGEQAAAGLDPDWISASEVAEFTRLNQAYRERFGFPFVICARENKKASILAGFRQRLQHDRDQEVATAIGEIGKIGHYRLRDLVKDDGESKATERDGA